MIYDDLRLRQYNRPITNMATLLRSWHDACSFREVTCSFAKASSCSANGTTVSLPVW